MGCWLCPPNRRSAQRLPRCRTERPRSLTPLSFSEEHEPGRDVFLDPVTSQLRDLRLVQDGECAREVLFLRLRADALQRHIYRNGFRLGVHGVALISEGAGSVYGAPWKRLLTRADRNFQPVLSRRQRAVPLRVVGAVRVVCVVEVDHDLVAVRVQLEITAGSVSFLSRSCVAKREEKVVRAGG